MAEEQDVVDSGAVELEPDETPAEDAADTVADGAVEEPEAEPAP